MFVTCFERKTLSMSASNSDISDTVAQLVAQLKQPADKKELADFNLKKEDLEEFLMHQAGKLVKGSVDFIEQLKAMLVSAPESKDIDALASYVASTASAIDTLNKLYITNKNEALKIKLKNMDFEHKKQLQTAEIGARVVMNREEILKKLIDEAKLIDAEVKTVPEMTKPQSYSAPLSDHQLAPVTVPYLSK